MPGWMCYVQGKTDPNEFFFGLPVAHDGPPHLSELKRLIEETVLGNNLIPDGTDYIVGDIDILDFRLNQWVNLDSRGMLYSGCQLAAIRDTVSGTCAGPFDISSKGLDAKVLGFAQDAQRTFEALDAESEGVVKLKSVLKSLRHDVNYAVEVFTKFDVRATGTVTYQDFISVYNTCGKEYIKELRERLQHGGRPVGHFTKENDAFNQSGTAGIVGVGGFDDDSMTSPRPDRRGSAAGGGDASGLGGSLPLVGIKGTFVDRGGRRSEHPEAEPSLAATTSGVSDRDRSGTASPTNTVATGDGSTSAAPAEESNVTAARQVVELLQKSISKKRESSIATSGGNLTASMVSKLKGLRKGKSGDASPGGSTTTAVEKSSASNAGSAAGSAAGSPGLRKPTR